MVMTKYMNKHKCLNSNTLISIEKEIHQGRIDGYAGEKVKTWKQDKEKL